MLVSFPSRLDIDGTLKEIRPMLQEHKDHLKALRDGESFTPELTAKKSKGKKKRARSSTPDSDSSSPAGKKRKRSSGKEPSSKRRRSDPMDEDDDDFIVDDDEELDFDDDEDSEDKKSHKGSDDDDDDGDDDDDNKDQSDSETEGGEDEDDQMEEGVTEESLQKKIEETDTAIKEGRVQLSEQRRLRKEAMDQLAALKKKQDILQREKNAFCSLKRSEVCRRAQTLLGLLVLTFIRSSLAMC